MGDWHAKHLVLAALALIVGLVVGGLGPRGKIRDLEAEVATAKREARRDVGRQIFGEVFRPRTAPAPAPGGAAADPVPDEPADPDPGDDADDDGNFRIRVERRGDEGDEGEGGSEPDAQAMKDALDLRRAQASAALREQAEATDEQMAEVDAIAADMNADLHDLAEDFVATVAASGGRPNRRELMVFAADALDVLIGTEDSLSSVLDPAQLESLDDRALDPTAFVDGTLVDVMSKLDR